MGPFSVGDAVQLYTYTVCVLSQVIVHCKHLCLPNVVGGIEPSFDRGMRHHMLLYKKDCFCHVPALDTLDLRHKALSTQPGGQNESHWSWPDQ